MTILLYSSINQSAILNDYVIGLPRFMTILLYRVYDDSVTLRYTVVYER